MGKNRLFGDYEAFVGKFKPKKTTDDCYTPEAVYDCVREWVDGHVCPLDGLQVMRPFWPGGDYEGEEYGPDSFVLDNPPFSILAKIVDYYLARRVRFFLFAPGLTLFNYGSRPGVTGVVVDFSIVYANGARVNTGFLTNCYPGNPAFVVAGGLRRKLKEVQRRREGVKTQRRLAYPAHVVSAGLLGKLAGAGLEWEAPRGETFFVRRLNNGQSVFGGGFLLSERLAAERLAAEKMELDEREWGIVKSLKKTT